MQFIRTNGRGILLCLILALPAWWLGSRFPGPILAILLGMLVAIPLKDQGRMAPGIKFTSKKVLQWAVILLGFGLDLTVVLRTGKQSLPIILCTITASLVIAFVLHKVLHISSKISTLIGVGSSICGGSAIAATAPVIDADDEEIAQSISVIFLFNIAAALIFPSLGGLLGLSDAGFGLFAGTAVNDTSSVTAAAAAWDGIHHSNTLEAATIVKLTRTLAIIPITLVLSLMQAKKAGTGQGGFRLKNACPLFILWFVCASVVTTICTSLGVPSAVFQPLKELSKFFIIMAMAAIGLNSNVVKLVKSGGKPLLLGACCWAGITAVSLLMQRVMGLW